jgi:hypothetical protein
MENHKSNMKNDAVRVMDNYFFAKAMPMALNAMMITCLTSCFLNFWLLVENTHHTLPLLTLQ